MKFGVALGRLNPSMWVEATVEAERLGYESVWIPEHLVFPIEVSGSPHAGQRHPPVPPTTPVFDVFAYLSFLAARTSRIKLATHVYNLALRHPFVGARAVATLDVLSGGRAIVGVGAGWLKEEWQAAGLDPATRGRRLDEALDVCRRLWTSAVVEHHGEFYDFPPVAFEPKPVQQPHPPVHVGGTSDAALRRAAGAQGWVAMDVTPSDISRSIGRLRELGASSGFEVSCSAGADDLEAWRDSGVDRIIVAPWTRSSEAIDGLRRLAEQELV